MAHRQSMFNGYPVRSGTALLPASYQPEPIPMMNGPSQPYQSIPMAPQYKPPSIAYNNSFRNNRVAPPPQDYNGYSQPSRSFETPTSMISTKPLIQTSQMYRNNPNQPYYQQNNYPHPDNNPEQNDKEPSCFAKPLCLGLTRLSGGILFGTMTFLAVASISGLITSIVLYAQDSSTDPQWKILGMVVCAIMLLTVIVTLCIFIYCYKQGRILNNNGTNSFTRQYNQENDRRNPYDDNQENGFRKPYNNNNQPYDSRKPYNYNQSYDPRRPYNNNQPYDRSPIPHGMMRNGSPFSGYDDIIQVQDKQTNTETTTAPLRPRDFQSGVWSAINAYGGVSYRPQRSPKTVSRFVQVFASDIEQSFLKLKNQVPNNVPTTVIRRPGTRLEYADEQRPRRVVEPQPQYEIVEEIIERPRRQSVREIIERPRRQSVKEIIEIIELPKKAPVKKKYNKVSVTHVKTIEQPNVVDDDFNTDHFYQ